MAKTRVPRRIKVLLVLLLLVITALGGFRVYMQFHPTPSCSDPLGGAKILRTQLGTPATFGGVIEYPLPHPVRNPNALTVAPDGSVWFGEQTTPILAHFYPNNRTLVEYALPYSYEAAAPQGGVCNTETNFWGETIWNGKVWVGDTAGNQIVGLDPSTGAVTSIRIPTTSSFPYTLTPGPNDTLWFTELYAGKIGEINANGTLREYPLPGGTYSEPAQVVFANSTTGYYDDVGASETQGGGIYSFNVNDFSPQLLGGQHLVLPNSITLASGALWVALHGSSSVAAYNFTTKSWSYYPTSYVVWNGTAETTLPYFVQANGSEVWLNEHYGNRIALIDPASGSLTEYSESAVPDLNGSTIGNALTFAQGGGRAWFVEFTGNVLGYVNASYHPPFSTSIEGNTTISLPVGSSTKVNLLVSGTSTKNGTLALDFADTDTATSKPGNFTFTAPSTTIIQGAESQSTITVTIAALNSLKPGTYFAMLGVTDGITYESSFLKIVVAAS